MFLTLTLSPELPYSFWRVEDLTQIPNTRGSLRQLRVLKHLADALLDVLVANAPVEAESKTLKKIDCLECQPFKKLLSFECQLSF